VRYTKLSNGLIVVLWITFGCANLNAQHEFGTWAGTSAGTPTLIGTTKPVSLQFIAVRYSRVFIQRSAYSLRYTADFIPFARITEESTTTGGIGAAPIGFEMRFLPGSRLQPGAAISGGFIYFDNDIPSGGGAQFNFTADLGAGLHIHLGRSIGLNTGYKYHHLSNGYRAPLNPGFDSNIFFIGVDFKK
jgi:Lipid A 3-O-deacylase (PagL)